MSTTSSNPLWRRFGPVVGAAMVLTVFPFLYAHQHAMGVGWLCGGLAGIAVILLLRRRRTPDPGPISRGLRGEQDERDRQLAGRASGFALKVTQLGCALGCVAVICHANPVRVLAALMWISILVQLGSYLWLERRG